MEPLHLVGQLLLALLQLADVDADDDAAAARHVADIGASPLAVRPARVGLPAFAKSLGPAIERMGAGDCAGRIIRLVSGRVEENLDAHRR